MATFLAPERKVAYVAVPKVASTTFEWLMADLAGLDQQRFLPTLTYAPTREQTVHAGSRWPRRLRASRPTPADAEASGVDSSWFVFSAVRDPRERLWSAWQSKLLVRRRRYVDDYGSEPWFPRIPRDASDVIADFARFVEALTVGATDLVHVDGHFGAQARTVLDGPFAVSRLYEVRGIPTLLDDLAAHLRPYGVDVPALRRDNTTPLKLTADVLDNGVGDAIVDVYRDDFDRLGHLWPADPRTASSDSWTKAAILDVRSRIDLHERVEDLAAYARDLRVRRTALRAQVNGT